MMQHQRRHQAVSSAVKLPDLGLMGCAKLHRLVLAALGIPLGEAAGPAVPSQQQQLQQQRHNQNNSRCSKDAWAEAGAAARGDGPRAWSLGTAVAAADCDSRGSGACSGSSSSSNGCSSCSSGSGGQGSSGMSTAADYGRAAGPYLFNEQFIIKPPRSTARSAFGWHRDSDWCRGRPEFQYSPYISVWTALDDMEAGNGALAVIPQSHLITSSHHAPAAAVAAPPPVQGGGGQQGTAAAAAAAAAVEAAAQLEPPPRCSTGAAAGASGGTRTAAPAPPTAGAGALPHQQQQQLLLLPAGSVVVFSDTLLHASGPNASRHMRRAWMPQFSAAPILRRHCACQQKEAEESEQPQMQQVQAQPPACHPQHPVTDRPAERLLTPPPPAAVLLPVALAVPLQAFAPASL
ncbi:hypothetical protein HYH02_013710 [Chlamydomonas schloesseri]|uniref:Phytanoyl-CoA dioxygenase n=1 Tax=Chlamydomonas schloesseri TaxID=2026947 RepID=A0A835VZ50_9CHLO|nr:hypothetical protein HYH02_013710 [Chlamydomonas schloesseri]|eukprot:KAG2430346.1 hypothetical protein HYH02_013710 [Chlamydomonas schloesseri]